MYPTPGPSPLAFGTGEGGKAISGGEMFPVRLGIATNPLPSPVPKAKGEGRGVE